MISYNTAGTLQVHLRYENKGLGNKGSTSLGAKDMQMSAMRHVHIRM